MTEEPDEALVRAHSHSSHHRPELEASERCACFHCLEEFPPADISEWVDAQSTALCPRCGVDAVLGTEAGFPLTRAFLQRMHQQWF